jgi:outer membrane lipoprotein carrier protein
MLTTLLLFIFGGGPALPAAGASGLAEAIEAHYRRTRTLEAVFLERYSEGRHGVRVESGTVYFSRPGRMRWEYESPEAKLFLVDGTNVWFYVPADRSATREKLKESSDWRTPFALITGKAKLSRLCGEVEELDSGDAASADRAAPGNRTLRCRPRVESRGAGSFREILLEVNSACQLVRVVIREPGDVETEFRFGNWQENIPLPEVKFHFEPPPGVAIVDQAVLAGQIH